MIGMENLLNCDGKWYACKINGIEVSGRITVEGGTVYLCQNEQNGHGCENKRGYKYSWFVSHGSQKDLSRYGVTNFRLYPLTRSEVDSYKDWQVRGPDDGGVHYSVRHLPERGADSV